jgi:hypothetical protein
MSVVAHAHTVAATPATSRDTLRLCSRTEEVNPQPKLVTIHRPQWGEQLGRPRHLQIITMPKMLQVGPCGRTLDSNADLPVSSPVH